jgi:hypothetical protein
MPYIIVLNKGGLIMILLPLTEKQLSVYDYIYRRIIDGIPPTFREIASEFKFTVKSAYDVCSALHRKNRITLGRSGQARSIILCKTENELGIISQRSPSVERVYKKTPKLKKSSICFICGSEKNLHRHHPDYTNPDLIVPLCHRCHLKLHLLLKKYYCK